MDGFDFGSFVEQIGDKVANIKGYDDLSDLVVTGAAKNVARITDNSNETKQTPPVVTPTPYSLQLLASQKSAFGMTKAQLLVLGAIGVAAAVLLLRRR